MQYDICHHELKIANFTITFLSVPCLSHSVNLLSYAAKAAKNMFMQKCIQTLQEIYIEKGHELVMDCLSFHANTKRPKYYTVTDISAS